MDRDQRWERTQRAYDAIVEGKGEQAQDPIAAVEASYEGGVTDEFIEPIVLEGRPRLSQGGRRGDLLQLPPGPGASADLEAARRRVRRDDDDALQRRARLPRRLRTSRRVEETLAEVLAENGLRQLHAAETEKYAHVTYFFNGGREEEWPGETRLLVPSPREVGTYDKKPEMSAAEVAERFCEALEQDGYQLRDRQLRQPGHGRPHRRDPGGGQGRRDRGCVPGPRGRNRRARSAA